MQKIVFNCSIQTLWMLNYSSTVCVFTYCHNHIKVLKHLCRIVMEKIHHQVCLSSGDRLYCLVYTIYSLTTSAGTTWKHPLDLWCLSMCLVDFHFIRTYKFFDSTNLPSPRWQTEDCDCCCCSSSSLLPHCCLAGDSCSSDLSSIASSCLSSE
jgi:hypothetical protein